MLRAVPASYGLEPHSDGDRDRFTTLASSWALECYVSRGKRDELFATLQTLVTDLVNATARQQGKQ